MGVLSKNFEPANPTNSLGIKKVTQGERIESFQASISLTSGLGRLDLVLEGNKRKTLDDLPPHVFASAMAILQGSPRVYFARDIVGRQDVIGIAPERPGV